ncbi:MAG: hypothetical protein KDA84_10330, partial [Planctomycetaceae bacterium]|nr:hypothetical protein [Planctomycetaceae bacterium]
MHTSSWQNRWWLTRWLWVMVLGAFGICGAFPGSANAGTGEMFDLQAQDLHLVVDTRWAGTAQGGYYPVRIQVENFGEDCQLTIRFTPYPDQQLPTVERRDLQIASGSKALITLSIPMVGRGAIGYLEVEKGGVLIEQLKRQLALSHADHRSQRLSILIISNDGVSANSLENGIHFGQRVESRVNLDLQVIQPHMLPSLWIDYTGLDIVMLPLKVLADLDSDKRSAILQWTQTGGVLVVYKVGQPANASSELNSLLGIPDVSSWQPARTSEWRELKQSFVPRTQGGFDEPGHNQVDRGEDNEWPVTDETFNHQDFMLGRVYAFREDPFPGTPWDWAWWATTIPADLSIWEARMGVLPRRANENFFNFLIPGVTSVPIYAFLVLMTLFTIVIGPLNYFFLRRRKQTYLLLLTIPVIAFVTSLTLFAYSTLAYGFSVASRSRSLTIL